MKTSKKQLVIVIVTIIMILTGCGSASDNDKAVFATLAPDTAQEEIAKGTIKELAYHDNTPVQGASPWGDGSEQQTPKIEVMFTPDSYPAIPTQVKLYISNTSGKDQLFTLYAYPDKEGNPDTATLLFKLDDQSVPQEYKDWKTYDLPAIQISEGSIWLVVEWKDKPLNEQQGQNSFYLFMDAKVDGTNRNHFCFMNDTCSEFTSLSPNLGDVLMTLVVSE